MSDTKALCEVVSAALDHHGNGKAQDAFETLKGRLERAEADNAALLAAISTYHEAWKTGRDGVPFAALLRTAHNPHPGAALLEELEGLRRNLGAIANLLGFAPGHEASDGLLAAVEARLQSINHIRDNTLDEAAHVAKTARHSVVIDESFDVYAKACLEIERRIRALKTGQLP